MAITYPLDLLTGFPGWSIRFEPMYRQEQSRTAGGRTIVRDLGTPLWRGTWRSKEMSPNDLGYWRARLETLENGIGTFIGYDMNRCYPIADPGGLQISGSQTIEAVGVDNKTLDIEGFPAGYELRPGDFISYTIASGERFLRRVVAGAVADTGGSLGPIEVRPHLAFGTLAGQPVTVVKPWVPMMIVPGSVDTTAALNGRGSISFEAMEAK